MVYQPIRIKVNEKEMVVSPSLTLLQLKDQFKPNANVVIYNGFPIASDHSFKEGDEIIFIQKGEVPTPEEFECLMMARHTPGVHQKIKKAIVGIAGLGGLGSTIAIALARIGVGTLILVDFDVVEPSNLNRQQYFIDQIGMPKVDALRENLTRINPYVHVITHDLILNAENVIPTFADVQVVVEAFDRADMKAMIINAITERYPDKYIIAASGVAGYEDGSSIGITRLSSKIFIVGDLKTAAKPGTGLMAPRVGIASHHQANLALRILLGKEG